MHYFVNGAMRRRRLSAACVLEAFSGEERCICAVSGCSVARSSGENVCHAAYFVCRISFFFNFQPETPTVFEIKTFSRIMRRWQSETLWQFCEFAGSIIY